MRSRKVLTAVNLSDAVRGCDTYAKDEGRLWSMALGSEFSCSGLNLSIEVSWL